MLLLKKNENVQYVSSIYLFVENKCIKMIQLMLVETRVSVGVFYTSVYLAQILCFEICGF